MAKTANIPCPACKGTGSRRIGKEYHQTLTTLTAIQPATCFEVACEMQRRGMIEDAQKGTIIHKRVERLKKWGLVRPVKRQRSGGKAKCPAWAFRTVN